jgi:hypothetical protein
LTGRPNYDEIFESVKEWHQHSPNDFVGMCPACLIVFIVPSPRWLLLLRRRLLLL